ncbi:hypothetical protein COB57_02505 [Candidatus Peregrinibacteria bacterium]|nr:MAG: hypothetical protein COB57_02505 [Candidatus Peregrinibacteria bacterium]
MRNIIKKTWGLTFIEIVIAVSISAILLTGIVVSFQNFAQYQEWIVYFSRLQQHSVREMSVLERSFSHNMYFQTTKDLTVSFSRVFGRRQDSPIFSEVSVVKTTDTSQEIGLSDMTGHVAIHSGVLFSGMVQQGDFIYIVDTGNHIIRRYNTATGAEAIYAGQMGSPGEANASTGTSAQFRNPTGVAYYLGKLYVVDTGNHVVRSIVVDALDVNRVVTTFAGNISAAGNGNGIITSAYFAYPTGIAIDSSNGDMYISDTGNHQIKKISNGVVLPLIGTGVSGRGSGVTAFSQLLSYQIDTPTTLVYNTVLGQLFVNDFNNKRIIRVSGSGAIQVTHEAVYFGGVRMYTNGLSKTFLEYQNMKNGRIYSLDVTDFQIYDVLKPQIYNNFHASKYLHNNFMRVGEDIILSGLQKKVDAWDVRFIDVSLSRIIPLYGESGSVGQLSVFDPEAMVFASFVDFIGDSVISKMKVREGIIQYNENIYELIVKYTTEAIREQTDSEISYSLLLGFDNLSL